MKHGCRAACRQSAVCSIDRLRLMCRVSHKKRHNGFVADSGARSRVVVIVVFDGVKLLDAAGAAEVFAEANRITGSRSHR